MDDLKKQLSKEIIEHQSNTDYLTLILIFVALSGHIILGILQYTGHLSFLISTILGCIIMNMSFTFWHECAHGNLSRSPHLNRTVGVLTSWFSFFPGYFARRREHLVHHKFEGLPGKDPVYYRIQKTSALRFLWTAMVINYFAKNPDEVPTDFLPLSEKEKWLDRITVGSVCALILLLGISGHFSVALALIILPRLFIFIFHGYVICFYPHFLAGTGYQKYRVFPGNLFLNLITMNQCYHGIHHFSPRIRWYNYPLVYRKYHSLFANNQIEVRK